VIVVSDASCLIALSAVGELQILRALHGEVIVPPAVWGEVSTPNRPGWHELRAAEWIRVVLLSSPIGTQLTTPVGPGEAEAIALAVELGADVLLVDERRARKVAISLGIPVMGVLGILLEAKARGLIASVKVILDAMEAIVAFRLKKALYDATLRAAGE
jgi:predicted nucleic acid-binding protein